MDELTGLLKALRLHSSILVTGPQRSGTTIGARVLAVELGRTYVDEDEVAVHDVARAEKVLALGSVVLQAPGLCHVAHTFECAVVLMRRSVDAIIRSQQRIGWGANEGGELTKYGAASGPVAQVKYGAWDVWQKDQCTAPFELKYEALCGHALWVAPEQRAGFAARQWKP